MCLLLKTFSGTYISNFLKIIGPISIANLAALHMALLLHHHGQDPLIPLMNKSCLGSGFLQLHLLVLRQLLLYAEEPQRWPGYWHECLNDIVAMWDWENFISDSIAHGWAVIDTCHLLQSNLCFRSWFEYALICQISVWFTDWGISIILKQDRLAIFLQMLWNLGGAGARWSVYDGLVN